MTFISQTSQPRDVSRSVIADLDCDASVYVGAWVYMSNAILYNAIATSKNTSNVIGFVESKSTTLKATIRLSGLAELAFADLDDTKEYFLSESLAGGMDIPPVPKTAGSIVLRLGHPIGEDKFIVNIGQRLQRS